MGIIPLDKTASFESQYQKTITPELVIYSFIYVLWVMQVLILGNFRFRANIIEGYPLLPLFNLQSFCLVCGLVYLQVSFTNNFICLTLLSKKIEV